MTAEQKKMGSLESIAWLERLPDGGGAWGKGLVETVATLEAEAEGLEKAANEAALKAKARRRLAAQTAKRADREAATLFPGTTITRAKMETGGKAETANA